MPAWTRKKPKPGPSPPTSWGSNVGGHIKPTGQGRSATGTTNPPLDPSFRIPGVDPIADPSIPGDLKDLSGQGVTDVTLAGKEKQIAGTEADISRKGLDLNRQQLDRAKTQEQQDYERSRSQEQMSADEQRRLYEEDQKALGVQEGKQTQATKSAAAARGQAGGIADRQLVDVRQAFEQQRGNAKTRQAYTQALHKMRDEAIGRSHERSLKDLGDQAARLELAYRSESARAEMAAARGTAARERAVLAARRQQRELLTGVSNWTRGRISQLEDKGMNAKDARTRALAEAHKAFPSLDPTELEGRIPAHRPAPPKPPKWADGITRGYAQKLKPADRKKVQAGPAYAYITRQFQDYVSLLGEDERPTQAGFLDHEVQATLDDPPAGVTDRNTAELWLRRNNRNELAVVIDDLELE